MTIEKKLKIVRIILIVVLLFGLLSIGSLIGSFWFPSLSTLNEIIFFVGNLMGVVCSLYLFVVGIKDKTYVLLLVAIVFLAMNLSPLAKLFFDCGVCVL